MYASRGAGVRVSVAVAGATLLLAGCFGGDGEGEDDKTTGSQITQQPSGTDPFWVNPDGNAAAQVAAYVNYITPVKGTKEAITEIDPSLAENPLIFPPPDVQAKLKAYPALSPEDERTMQEAMAQVTGA